MTYLTHLILQKSILRSQFFSLALTIVLLVALQTIPANAQQPWSTADPKNILDTGKTAALYYTYAGNGDSFHRFNTTSTNNSTPTERMRIDKNGNVGIGTLSPAQRLSVAGVIESTTGGFKFLDGTTQSKAGGGEQFIGEFADFPTAISSIGSVQTTLVINSVATISSQVTVPSTINLRFTGAGSLSARSGVTLTIADGNSIKAGPQQIFSLSGTGTVRFTKFPDVIYPEWWGAKGDDAGQDSPHSGSATDNLAAFNAMTDSVSHHAARIFASTKVQLSSNRVYYLSNTWNIRTALDVGCEGGFGWAPCSYLRFPANKTKVIVHSLSTFTGNTAGGDYASWTKLHNFGIIGVRAEGATTHTVNINGLRLTKTAGDDFADNLGYHEGNTIAVNGFAYQMNAFVSTTQVTLKAPRIYIKAMNGLTTIYHKTEGAGTFPTGTNDWNGSTFAIGGTIYTLSTVNATAGEGNPCVICTGSALISPAFSGTTGNYTVALSGANVTAGAARPNLYHGIDARGVVWIEGMYVKWNDGNAINLDSGLGQTSIPGTVPNTNNSRIVGNYLYLNRGNGIYTKGINANQMSISNNDYSNNHGAGAAEFSFLGNNYYGNHSSFNGRGPVNTAKNGVNVSNFLSDYSESGQPSEYYGQNMIVMGGNHGAGVSTTDSDLDFKHLIGGTAANGRRDAFLFAASDVATGNIGGPVTLKTMPADNFYGLTTADRHVVVGGTTGSLNFPAASANTGRDWTVTSTASGVVSFIAGGALDVSSIGPGDSVTLFSDGTNWKVKATGGPRSATALLSFTALAANTCEVLTVALIGAVDGDSVSLGIPNALADVDGATESTTFFGWVSSSGTVSVRRCNVTRTITADPAAALVRVSVVRL